MQSDPRYGQPRQLHQAVSGGRPPSMPPPIMPPPGADPNRPTGLRLLAGIFTKLTTNTIQILIRQPRCSLGTILIRVVFFITMFKQSNTTTVPYFFSLYTHSQN
jgi:hypothetical protein